MKNEQAPTPKVGILALTLELYETLAPDLRASREEWLREKAIPALEVHAEVVFDKAVFTRSEITQQVAHLEAAGADALLVILLTYSPSQLALPALMRTGLPILVWNTQELFAIDEAFTSQDMTDNHGVHGTQDLCNVLLRSGVKFEYVTSHLDDENPLAPVVDFLHAASAVRRLRSARIGLIGYPFPGMGDFALDTTHFVATLGCEWVNIPIEEYVTRAAGAERSAVRQLVDEYRETYEVQEGIEADDLDLTARVEIALRGMVEDHGLAALTYQFMAFGEDERTPTVPFVAMSRLMAEGIGFGGEGDLIACAGSVLLNALQPPAGFTEIFTIDFGGNGILLSHMGEANVAMARRDRKTPMAMRSSPITRTRGGQLVLVTSFEPGPATLFALTLGPKSRWRFIVSPMTVQDFGPLPDIDVPHSKLLPAGDVRDFLSAYARAGGPHHHALCFGDARERLSVAAALLDADFVEV